MSVHTIRKMQAICSVQMPVQMSTKATLKTSTATGIFIILFAVLIITGVNYLVGIFSGEGGFNILNLIIFILIAIVAGWIWISRKKILPKSVQA